MKVIVHMTQFITMTNNAARPMNDIFFATVLHIFDMHLQFFDTHLRGSPTLRPTGPQGPNTSTHLATIAA
jgi:hypothetical protein